MMHGQQNLKSCYFVWPVPLRKDDALNEDGMVGIFSRYLVMITANFFRVSFDSPTCMFL